MPVSESDENTDRTETDWGKYQPTNYDVLTESISVALKHRGVSEETIQAALTDVQEAVVNHEDDFEWECSSPRHGNQQTLFQIENVPQEAIDYAFDQMEANSLDQLIEHREQPLGGELELDYDNQQVILDGRTVLEASLIETIDEKIAGMMYEIEHGERKDFTLAELHEVRKAMAINISEKV